MTQNTSPQSAGPETPAGQEAGAASDPTRQNDVARPARQDDVARPARQDDVARPARQDDVARPARRDDVVCPAREDGVPRPARQDDVTRPARRDIVPALYLVGFLVLGSALIWLWQNPQSPPPPSSAIESRLEAIEARLTRIESIPKSSPVDLAPTLSRLAALETRPAVAPAPAADLSGLETRLAELEARPKLAPPDPALASELAKLSSRTARTARVQAASAALDAGQAVGSIPGSPAALQIFADAAPPTEAGLRLAFPAAAQAALEASRPADAERPALERYWDRAQALVTIRRGSQVLVGDPAAGTLALAKRDLDAGDLAGAVTLLGALNPGAAQAMSGWLADARALLAARAALAALAAQP